MSVTQRGKQQETGGYNSGLFIGSSEMASRCRAFDWSSTPLGPVTAWSQSLRTTVSTMLASRHPMFLWWGPDLVQIFNDGYLPSFGTTGRDLVALGARGREHWAEIWHLIGPEIQNVLSTGEATWHEDHLVPIERNGHIENVWWTYGYSPVRDDNGAIGGVLVVVQETTSRVLAVAERDALLAAERAARAETDRLRADAEDRAATLAAVFESIPDAVFVGNAGGVTGANAPALEQLGFTTLAELYRAIPVLAAETQTRDAETGRRLETDELPLMRAISDGVRSVRDVLVRHRVSDEDRILRCSAAPVIVDGKVVAGVCVNTDVTDLRRAAAERDRALAAAEAANRNKSEFLAVMSHELRTPLNAIGGYAELIEMGLRGPVTEQQRADLEHIQQSQRHVLGLITQVLNYTRVELGTVRYEFADVSVATAVDSAEVLIIPQVRARRLDYSLEEFDNALVVRADADKLRQILVNLLTNAIKFTEAGGRIAVSCAGIGAEIAITVSDTGIGIAPEKLATIFEPFVQVQQPLTRHREGVGLGLAISRDLARGMGGDLTVASTLGSGSAFTVRLPAACPGGTSLDG